MAVEHWEPAPRRFVVWSLARGINDPIAYGVAFNHGPTIVVQYTKDPHTTSGLMVYPDHNAAEKALPSGRVDWLDGWYPAAEIEVQRLDWWHTRQTAQDEIRRQARG